VISSVAGWLLGMRNVMVQTIADDYVLLAEPRDCARAVVFAYAARNAMLPNLANFTLSLASSSLRPLDGGRLLLSGSATCCSRPWKPGLPVDPGLFLMITLLVLAANLIADWSTRSSIHGPRRGARMSGARSTSAKVGLGIIAFFVLVAAIGRPGRRSKRDDRSDQRRAVLEPPAGTTNTGQDVFTSLSSAPAPRC